MKNCGFYPRQSASLLKTIKLANDRVWLLRDMSKRMLAYGNDLDAFSKRLSGKKLNPDESFMI